MPSPPRRDADQIVFVGTGGGRMTTAFQARATGGLWVCLDGVWVCVDPGPGALAHARGRALGLDPGVLDAVILTHKHLDHSGDINAMIEAMTEGGTKKRGLVLAPRDAYEEDPVILRYVRSYPAATDVLTPGGRRYDRRGRRPGPRDPAPAQAPGGDVRAPPGRPPLQRRAGRVHRILPRARDRARARTSSS